MHSLILHEACATQQLLLPKRHSMFRCIAADLVRQVGLTAPELAQKCQHRRFFPGSHCAELTRPQSTICSATCPATSRSGCVTTQSVRPSPAYTIVINKTEERFSMESARFIIVCVLSRMATCLAPSQPFFQSFQRCDCLRRVSMHKPISYSPVAKQDRWANVEARRLHPAALGMSSWHR
jgi:DNA-binding transcriptional regulator YdaS (Cro superfamily)